MDSTRVLRLFCVVGLARKMKKAVPLLFKPPEQRDSRGISEREKFKYIDRPTGP